MRYEPDDDFDFSWIREWRIHTEKLALDVPRTVAIVPDRHELEVIRARLPAEALEGWVFVPLAELGIPVVRL